MKFIYRLLIFSVLIIAMNACRTLPPIATAPSVNLERFMGDWYVMANIPTFIEKEAWNAVERYNLGEDGVIQTTFTFNKGAADGPLKTHRPKGFVRDTDSNAVWGMQFVWPIRAEFIIMKVDDDYQMTMIGRRKRDYVWIMARSPAVSKELVAEWIDFAVSEGYAREKIQLVPHQAE